MRPAAEDEENDLVMNEKAETTAGSEKPRHEEQEAEPLRANAVLIAAAASSKSEGKRTSEATNTVADSRLCPNPRVRSPLRRLKLQLYPRLLRKR